MTESQLEQRRKNGRKQTLVAFQPLLQHYNPDTIYTTAKLLQYISEKVITTSVKADYLQRINRGHYKINFTLIKGGN